MRHSHALMLSATLAVAAMPGLALARPAPAQTGTPTKARIEQQLQSGGYTKVHDLKFDDGLWQAKATSADGKSVDVKVDPNSGEILADKVVSQVGKDDIRASLSTSGYTDVHGIDFEDGVWKAKAKNANGDKVKLRLSPKDAGIIAVETD